MSNLTNTSTLKSQILQDVQCFIETSIDKLNSELALYGTENIYVPSTTNINLNPIPEFISNQSQSFDIQCAIPIVMEFSSPILTQDVGVNDYYQIFNKQIAQKAIDDINVYIRKLNTKIRGKSSGPSIFFTPKYYDINSTPTTTTTDIETRILSILNQIKTDLSSTTSGNPKLINIIVGLNNNNQITNNVKEFLINNNLLLLSPGASSSTLNRKVSLNNNIFRASILDEIQFDIFGETIKKNPITNLGVLYVNNEYGNRMLTKLKSILPSNINLINLSYDLNTSSTATTSIYGISYPVLNPSVSLTTLLNNLNSGSVSVNNNTGIYIIGDQGSQLIDFANSIINTSSLLQPFGNIQWFGNDLTFTSLNNISTSILSFLQTSNFTWFVPVPPSPEYSCTFDLSSFDSNLSFVNNPSNDLSVNLENNQMFFSQLFFAYHRDWAEKTILFDQKIIQDLPTTINSLLTTLNNSKSNRLPLDAYGLYDMIFLGVLTYVNTLEKQLPLTSDNLINNLIIQGGLYNGYKGWYRFNPNGSLPESYYAIQKLNNNSYVHVIPEFNIINSIQTISNQI